MIAFFEKLDFVYFCLESVFPDHSDGPNFLSGANMGFEDFAVGSLADFLEKVVLVADVVLSVGDEVLEIDGFLGLHA